MAPRTRAPACLAPGFVEIEAGRSALRLTTLRDLLLAQRLALQPELELAACGRTLKPGLRIRYEWRCELAPCVGVRWVGHPGESADCTAPRVRNRF